MSRVLRLGLVALALAACTVDDGADDGGVGGKSSTSKGGSAASSADAQIYVDAHNAVRAAVEPPAGYAGRWEPLPPVSWSAEVAATAQEWADHLAETLDCGLEHAQNRDYGENLAAGTRVGAQQAVDMWASEKSKYSYSPKYAFSADTGHYTQIVWRASQHIGCASAACARSTVVVCRYDPPGNFIGGAIF